MCVSMLNFPLLSDMAFRDPPAINCLLQEQGIYTSTVRKQKTINRVVLAYNRVC